MNIKLSNLESVAEEMLLGVAEAQVMSKYVLDEVTNHIHREWENHAKRSLQKTRQSYISGLQVVETGRLQNTIVLKGAFNNMLESGSPPFDMKKGFAKSDKRKFNSKGEWYLTIPMRHATPRALGENKAFSGVLPASVYKIILKKSKTSNQPLTKKEIPKKFQEIRQNKTSGYIHKSSIYEGLRRTTKTYNKVTQGKYVTFRRVGQNSDPNSWMHGGFPVLDLASRAVQSADIENESENAIDRFLKS